MAEDVEIMDVGTVKGNVVGALCYLSGILSGMLILILEKDNKFVRFHAIQSIILSLFSIVIFFIITFMALVPVIGWMLAILSPMIFVLWIVISIFLMGKAYKGEIYKLPIVGDITEKYSGDKTFF